VSNHLIREKGSSLHIFLARQNTLKVSVVDDNMGGKTSLHEEMIKYLSARLMHPCEERDKELKKIKVR
jgi:hypothetical protein